MPLSARADEPRGQLVCIVFVPRHRLAGRAIWRQTANMRTISISRPTFKGALWTLYAAALLNPVSGLAQRNAPPQNVVVDATPSHAVSSFSPFRSLGAGIDRLRGGVTDQVMTPDFIQKIQ